MLNPNGQKKRDLQAQLITEGKEAIKAEGVEPGLRSEIISSSIYQIVTGIFKGKWTATQTVAAFIEQAIKAHEATNCLTEILFDSAFKTAKELDYYFAQTGELRGPFHGVPITFKDQYEIEGVDTTIGFTHWIDQHAKQDAELVAQARSLGAIIIAKTNVPQTMMSFECENPLWGRTTNPYNKNNTSGGSSGGEAAVLRFSGSALGMGSDIGGSLRIPTSYCGIYSLKPTDMRFSGRGALGCVPGFMGITTVYGPMARSVEDVKYVCQKFFGLQATLPAATLPPVGFRDLDFSKEPLNIGYFKSDRFVRASPACQRAVQESVEALRRKGYKVEEINPPDMAELLKLFVEISAADGYKTMLSHLESDKQEPALFLVTLGPRLPAFVRAISDILVRLFVNDTTFKRLFGASRPRSVTDLWASSAARLEANSALQNHLWAQTLNLDALICPVQALPAIPHGATKTLTPLAASTLGWNVVECPVGVVPVTRVDPKKDALPADWWENTAGPVMRPDGAYAVKKEQVEPSSLLERAVYGSGRRLLQPLDDPVPVYDAKLMAGLPVGVQIVGKPWEDEKIIYIMEELDKALHQGEDEDKKRHPFAPSASTEWGP
ncbi:amidase signature domain-containing protein [Rhizoctonia solani]|nr:amidase signature domain-containing protein [Rhizoctonia solani]